MDKMNLTPVELNNQLKNIEPQKLLDSVPPVHYDFQQTSIPKTENPMVKEQQKLTKEVIELQNKLDDATLQLIESNNKIEEHNSIYEDTDEPIVLTNDVVQEILALSGVPDEITTKIEKSYSENFGDTPPIADILIDNKALAAKAQKKKEEMLEKQVKILENKLERVTQTASSNFENNVIPSELESEAAIESINYEGNEENPNDNISTENNLEEITNFESNEDFNDTSEIKEEVKSINSDTISENDIDSSLNADIVVKVNPEKVEQIETKIIDGKKYIVIPIDDNEQANVNGIEKTL